ncbi:MAG: histidine kinase, partial [Bradyrhizobium sp.]
MIRPLRFARTLAAGTAALWLTGCAVGPDFVTPPAPDVARYTPEKLTSPRVDADGPRVPRQRFVDGADMPALWWAAFRSKPLNELIRLSVQHN